MIVSPVLGMWVCKAVCPWKQRCAANRSPPKAAGGALALSLGSFCLEGCYLLDSTRLRTLHCLGLARLPPPRLLLSHNWHPVLPACSPLAQHAGSWLSASSLGPVPTDPPCVLCLSDTCSSPKTDEAYCHSTEHSLATPLLCS